MKKIKLSEADMAKYFISYFEHLGYKVFKEVDSPYGVCDFVATKGSEIIAVETKTTFNFSVLEQSINNVNFANYSYIAVPKAKNRGFQRRLCRDYGVGLLEIDYKYMTIRESVIAKFNDKTKKKIKLHDFQTLNEAGTKGTRITSFKDYIDSIKILLSKNGEMKYKDIYDSTRKHYSNVASFKSSIKKYIDKKIIVGLLYNKNGLYLP